MPLQSGKYPSQDAWEWSLSTLRPTFAASQATSSPVGANDAAPDIVAAVDPVQGLMSAKRESPDLILLDLMMPAGGGMQLLDRLATVGRARVVVVTAMDEPGLEAQAQSHGATAFVKKPVEPKAVAALVQQLLPQKRSD
ncbi:MAG TPA: response regulator [Gemmatimonadales bacterium]|nr:response regulator [Gemmatimonadales bacterium]